ncbi:hypothetical protein D9M69_551500 [compost metagenome]
MTSAEFKQRNIAPRQLGEMMANEMRNQDALRLPLDEDDAVCEEEIAVGRLEVALHEALCLIPITEDVGQIGHRGGRGLPHAGRRPAPKIAQIREVSLVRDVTRMRTDDQLSAIVFRDTEIGVLSEQCISFVNEDLLDLCMKMGFGLLY